MSFSPTSPVTGAAVSGFTTPTYTIAADLAPGNNGKQYAITALGGTQTNVEVHSVSKPFTLTMFRPAQLRALPKANPVTGVIKAIPVNQYKFIVRKGAQPAVNQSSEVIEINCSIKVPAGVDTYEPEDLKAAISLAIGVLSQQSSGIADTLITGIL